MQTIRELCNQKIWRAVEGMIKGLEKYGRNDTFVLHMGTWGCVYVASPTIRKPCGCAAIITVQQLTGIDYTIETINSRHERAEAVSIPCNDLHLFEGAIDALRTGRLGPIFDYFQKDRTLIGFRNLQILHTGNWTDNLDRYKELLHELKTLDL